MFPRVHRLLLATAASLLFTSTLLAQAKVAIIDMRQAVNETAEVKKAVAALEARLKPRQAEGEKLAKELQDIRSKLDLRDKLRPEAEQELMLQGQRKQKELQRIQEDLEAELQREQQDVGTKALTRMRDIVKKMAEEQQLDVVVDVSNTIYFKPAIEITKGAVAAYDKAYPAK